MKSYKKTSVNWAKSQTGIVKLLNQNNIYESRFTNLENKFALEFRKMEKQNNKEVGGFIKPIGVRVIVPFHTKKDDIKHEQEMNYLHRVLFYHLKSKFIAIDSGLTEFSEEFMPHLIIMDKNGNSTTMGQALLPQYNDALESGEQKEFKLLDDGK